MEIENTRKKIVPKDTGVKFAIGCKKKTRIGETVQSVFSARRKSDYRFRTVPTRHCTTRRERCAKLQHFNCTRQEGSSGRRRTVLYYISHIIRMS